jgi:pimeloyl-ACP methyl ester carboxylesterase
MTRWLAGGHKRTNATASRGLLQRLPNSRVVLIDARHFVWKEAPEEYTSIVRASA